MSQLTLNRVRFGSAQFAATLLWPDGLREMEISIRKDFGGIGMWCHRDDLVKHLDHVQLELDRGLEHFERHNPWVDEDKIKKRKGRYGHLKNVLLEVDKTAMETLTRTPPELTLFDLCANLVFRIPHRLHVFFVSPVSVILCVGRFPGSCVSASALCLVFLILWISTYPPFQTTTQPI